MKQTIMEAVVFIIAGLICSVGSFAVANKLFPPPDVEQLLAETEAAAKKAKKEKEKAAMHTAGADGEAAKSDSGGTHYELEPIIANLGGDSVRRYAKVKLTLKVKDEDISKEVEKKEPQVYDTLIKVLSNYDFKQLNKPDGKETLKEEVKSRLNLFLSRSGVEKVFLTEMIIQ